MAIEDSSGWPSGRLGEVVTAVDENAPGYVAHFDGGGGNRSQMMSSLAAFAEPVLPEFALLLESAEGHLPECFPQVRRSAFADATGGLLGWGLAALSDDRIEAGEGDELAGRAEGLNRIGFAEEADGGHGAAARECEQVVGQLVREILDLRFQLLADGLQGINLLQEQANAGTGAGEAAAHADGVHCGLADFVALSLSIPSAGGFREEFLQGLGLEFEDVCGARSGGQQHSSGLAE